MIARRALPGILASLVFLIPTAWAADHTNLEEGLPVTVEDAIPIAYRGREFQGLFRYQRTDDGEDRFVLEPRIEYGLARNWQAKLAVPFYLGNADRTGSGDVGVEVFRNLNQESLALPAFALSVRADFPTGERSEGIDTTAKLLLTKTLGRTSLLHRLHVNLAWKHNAGARVGERGDRFEGVLGYSRLVGPDTVLVGDYVFEQERVKGREGHVLELGVRRQVTPLTVVALGAGAGLSSESPKFRLTAAFQHSF